VLKKGTLQPSESRVRKLRRGFVGKKKITSQTGVFLGEGSPRWASLIHQNVDFRTETTEHDLGGSQPDRFACQKIIKFMRDS